MIPIVDYTQAIDTCRKHCQTFSGRNFYSYFLSLKKSCYCLPMKLTQTQETVAVRKPLKHCSFLPYVCNGFSTPCEKYYSEVNVDTLIKIDVQQYCSSSSLPPFIFDRIFYMCLKSILLRQQMNFALINYDQKCLPLVIKTSEQWYDLIKSTWITRSKVFIPIDRNSTFIFNELFPSENSALISNDFCIALMRTYTNETSYELLQCSKVHSPGYVLCAQKPLQSMIPYEEEFKMMYVDIFLIPVYPIR